MKSATCFLTILFTFFKLGFKAKNCYIKLELVVVHSVYLNYTYNCILPSDYIHRRKIHVFLYLVLYMFDNNCIRNFYRSSYHLLLLLSVFASKLVLIYQQLGLIVSILGIVNLFGPVHWNRIRCPCFFNDSCLNCCLTIPYFM